MGGRSTQQVLVVAAHPGAGASTLALAVAVTASEFSRPVRIVDCSERERSGLVAATDVELGTGEDGWARGRRGSVLIERRPDGSESESLLPSTERGDLTRVQTCVIDVGFHNGTRSLPASRLFAEVPGARVLLVHRVTVPGVRAVEVALRRLAGRDVVIAAVGRARWPGIVTASCGPLLSGLDRAHRIVPVPLDAELAITGLTTEPLPRPVLAAARAILPLVFPAVTSDGLREREAVQRGFARRKVRAR